MLWNWGVHCNTPGVGCIQHVMNHTIARYVQDPRFSQWHMMWRETEPQHFAYVHADGLFRPRRQPLHCGPASHAAKWRNEEAYHSWQNHLRHAGVAWVSIFRQLVPAWTFHYPTDCTHYCYTPWRVEITWDGMVQGLQWLQHHQRRLTVTAANG